LKAWQKEWQQALTPLDLPADTRAEEAIAAVEKLDTLFKKLEDAQNRRVRVEAMQGHVGQFDKDATGLVQMLAPELLALPSEQTATRLQMLLSTAQQNAVRRQGIEKQIVQEEMVLEKAKRELKQADHRQQDLMKKAHCSDLAALELTERKSARSVELNAQLMGMNTALTGFAAGATLEAFLADITGVSADQLPFDIAELERDIQTLDTHRSELEQQIGSERATLATMDGSDKATLAAEEAQSALAKIRTGTGRYLPLRLASEVLRRHIERYREQNQDPVISRASDFFPRLTLGWFARLKTSFDDKDGPVLLGVRPSGEVVEVSGMSDGTRDQLFLALRLASLERQLVSGEALPFIADDVLIKFDDDRARAALGVMVDLCAKTQLLFFTHHARLVELAQIAVPTELLKVHQLGVT
jgi:uncharacterized protein YhaN